MRLLKLLKVAMWRAFLHDAFGVAKGAAYSSIISIFPALLLIASILSTSKRTVGFVQEISMALGTIFPAGTAAMAQAYFSKAHDRPFGVLITTSMVTLWTGSGVMLSWMEGFRNAYELPKVWGVVRERLIAFGLVVMAGIPLSFATALLAFGNVIEVWVVWHAGHDFGFLILFLWTVARWLIATTTSVAVMLLIYHYAVPRTLRWHSVLPGAILATAIWFPATLIFGSYVTHYSVYGLVYGSLAAAIVLLVWLYIISCIVLIGAEFNALLYPRGSCKKLGGPNQDSDKHKEMPEGKFSAG